VLTSVPAEEGKSYEVGAGDWNELHVVCPHTHLSSVYVKPKGGGDDEKRSCASKSPTIGCWSTSVGCDICLVPGRGLFVLQNVCPSWASTLRTV
jgi:hypothetical protein